MALTLVGEDDGDRAGLKRCDKCGAPMDAWSHTPDGDLCSAHARAWMLDNRVRRLGALPMLWHLRDAIRAAEGTPLAAEVRNEELVLESRVGAETQQVTILRNEVGVLAYWRWYPGGEGSGVPLLGSLGDSVTEPEVAARQIVMERRPS